MFASAWKPSLATTEGIATVEQDYADVMKKFTYNQGCGLELVLSTGYSITGLGINTGSANTDHTTFGDHVTAFYRDSAGNRVSIGLGSVSAIIIAQLV